MKKAIFLILTIFTSSISAYSVSNFRNSLREKLNSGCDKICKYVESNPKKSIATSALAIIPGYIAINLNNDYSRYSLVKQLLVSPCATMMCVLYFFGKIIDNNGATALINYINACNKFLEKSVESVLGRS